MIRFKQLIQKVPYSGRIRFVWRFKTRGKSATRRVVPRIEVELKSLDRVSKLTIQTMKPWVSYYGLGRLVDTSVKICWSPIRGWWIEGEQTGRRTKPMPRVISAILCLALIWVFPDILATLLEHAGSTSEYLSVYWLVFGLTSIFSVLIGWYMWIGLKAGPSGLGYAIRQFAEHLKDKEENDADPNEESKLSNRDVSQVSDELPQRK